MYVHVCIYMCMYACIYMYMYIRKHVDIKHCGTSTISCTPTDSSLQITVGLFQKDEEVLVKPGNPKQLQMILYNQCAKFDVRQAVLQQELIIAIGGLIALSPTLFDGILKIRIGSVLGGHPHWSS